MESNYAQHRAFETGLVKFEELVYKVTPESYDGAQIKKMVDAFVPILTQHLTDEIQTLLGLEKYDHKELIKAWNFFNGKILENIKDKVCLQVLVDYTCRRVDCASIAFFPPH